MQAISGTELVANLLLNKGISEGDCGSRLLTEE